MSPAFQAALAFLQTCQNAETVEALDQAFAEVLAQFGFDTFGFVELHVPGRPIAPRLRFGRTDREWDLEYWRRRLHRIDPVVPYLFTAVRPFSWSDIEDWQATPERRRLFGEARDAGAGEGLIIPIHGAIGETHLVKLTTPETRVDPAVRPTLHAIAQVYAAQGRALLEAGPEPRHPPPPPLTEREIDCLSLVAAGKSDWDIGAILGISPNTVHTLVERAKRRLGVKTRAQAALTATLKGWLRDLSPD
jgi:DNA-binding CsgD family transcriptional regulator